MSSSADNELVARAVSGQDSAAFGELVRRHQSHVRNFLRKLSGDHTLADDLAQDCFLHAWDKLQTYTGRGSFIGWLLKVAYTTFLQSKRKSKRYAEILESAGHVADQESRSKVLPSDEIADRDRMAAISEENRDQKITSAGRKEKRSEIKTEYLATHSRGAQDEQT